MAEMKGIKVCGDCANYDWKKHKCRIGCNDDSNAQAPFYGDCPLPDVTPKSEVAREIIDEVYEKILTDFPDSSFVNAPLTTHTRLLAMIRGIKQKYTEDKK